MSRVKIVRKNGKLIRKGVRRAMCSWREDIIHLIAPHIRGTAASLELAMSLEEEDFLIWCIFVGGNFNFRMDSVTTAVRPIHDARGFEFRLDGQPRILRLYYNALTALLYKADARLKRWNYALDFLHEWDEPFPRMTLVFRCYPPWETVTYFFCKKMWETLPHTSHYTCGGALGLFVDVGNSVMEAKKQPCNTMAVDVKNGVQTNAQVLTAPTLQNLLTNSEVLEEP